MNLKKVKRILAISLAVMLALPPNVYGGPEKVRAEESTGEAQAVYIVTSISQPPNIVGTLHDDPSTVLDKLPNLLGVDYEPIDSNEKKDVIEPELEEKQIVENQTSIEDNLEEVETELEKNELDSKINSDSEIDLDSKPENELNESHESNETGETSETSETNEFDVNEEIKDSDDSGNTFVEEIVSALSPMTVYAKETSYLNTTWKPVNEAVNMEKVGTYVYEAVIETGSNYVLADGVEVPKVTIEIKSDIPEKKNPSYQYFFKEATMYYDGESYTYNLYNNTNVVKIYYKSSNPEIAEVDETGKVTPHKVGNTTITAYSEETKEYKAHSTEYTLHVIKEKNAYTTENDGEWRNSGFYIYGNDPYELLEIGRNIDTDHIWRIYANPVDFGEVKVGEYEFYVYDTKRYQRTGKRSIPYKIDRVDPYVEIHCAGKTWNTPYIQEEGDKALHAIYPNKATITASDVGSGLKSLQYVLVPFTYSWSNLEERFEANGIEWIDYRGQEIVLDKGWNVIYAKATDYAGNVTYVSTEYIDNCPLHDTYYEEDTNTKNDDVNYEEVISKPELNVSVSNIKAYTYTGKAITPKPVVKDGKKKLKLGKNYTLSYENNVNAGTGTVVIHGTGAYEGEKRVSFTIYPQNIAKKVRAKVIGKKFLFTGAELTPSVSLVYNKRNLAAGSDYTISYANNVAKGNAQIYITGKGNYAGTKVVKFKITGPKMKDTQVTLTPGASALDVPQVTVTYQGKTCQEGVDYTVKYPPVMKNGKNKIQIKGTGNFSGSVSRTYFIQ